MRAVLCAGTGLGAVTVGELARPEVSPGSVLIRVRASSANPVDMFPTGRVGYMMGGRKPQVLGADFAGTVEAVGDDVTDFQVGDDVLGAGRAAFAEYKVVTASGPVVRKPAGVSFAHAGVVGVAATTALQALRDHGQIESRQKVLVNGASGGVGTFAVQIAKALGAEVTAVCHARNVELAASLGADRVIDYTTADFTRDDARYDLIIDIAGSRPYSACTRVLEPRGSYVGVGFSSALHGRGSMVKVVTHLAGVRFGSLIGSRHVVVLFLAKMNKADLQFLAGLLGSGEVTPVIDRTYQLAQAVDALRYLDTGHARAKIAIEVGS